MGKVVVAKARQLGLPETKTAQVRRMLGISAGQIVHAIKVSDIPEPVVKLMIRNRKGFLTRNSRCPCGSGIRYKRCHGREARA